MIKRQLSARRVESIKPDAKERKYADGGGLTLIVRPSGHKSFLYRYRFRGKAQTLTIGAYPDISLADAREAHEKARNRLARGIDPRLGRSTPKSSVGEGTTFGEIAWEWFERERTTVDRLGKPNWSPGHVSRVQRIIDKDLCPRLGKMMPDDVSPRVLLEVLRKIQDRGAVDIAHRANQYYGQIVRYAIRTDRATSDITQAMKGALKSRMPRRFAAITDNKTLSEMLGKIDAYQGSYVIRCALKLMPLIFVRPGELVSIKWEEVDFEAREIRIPEERLKRKDRPADHIVPLADQAILILEEIRPYTEHSSFVFPQNSDPKKHIAGDSLRQALRRMGFTKEQATTHGFRRTATTMLTEQGWDREITRRQLAHIDPNAMHAIYDSAELLADRRKLMEAWANYLDSLRPKTNTMEQTRN